MKKYLLIFSFLILPMMVWAGSAILTWDVPTTNVDGSPLTDLAGYKLYYGTAPATYPNVIDAGLVTTYTITGLSNGRWYFAVTAYDAEGNESFFSNEVTKLVDTLAPSSPVLQAPAGGQYV